MSITVLAYKKVKTRKINRCFSCFRDFAIGSEMFRWSCVDYGDFSNGHTCITCDEIISELTRSEDFSDGISEGYIHEMLNPKIGLHTPEQLLQHIKDKKPL